VSLRRAPVWTGVVIGLLFGMVLVAGFLLVRDRTAAPPAAAVGAEAASAAVETPAADDTVATVVPAGDPIPADDGASIDAGRRNAIVRATERVAPAVVSINVVQHRTVTRSIAPRGFEFWERFYPGLFPRREFQQDLQSLGSGVIVGDEGYVITNAHVVDGGDEVIVTLNDGRQLDAEVLEAIGNWDLALLRIQGEDLPVAPMAEPGQELYIGEWAIAIGSPFGYLLADTQPTVTVGVISAVNRDIKQSGGDREYLGMIQTDAAINPGNSGGPLLNGRGEVIGINTFIFTESGGSIGLGFAVPIERAQWMIREVRQYGYFRRGYSGLTLQMLTPPLMNALGLEGEPRGFVVREVQEDSPAWKAGLRVYDVIRSIGGVELRDKATLDRLVYEATVGSRLEFEAEREGERITGAITLEEAPRTPR